MKVGDAVVIADHSEAHGDKGVIAHIQENGIIIVALESGCYWPVMDGELKTTAGATVYDARLPHLDARPDHVRRAEAEMWRENEAQERARI